MMKKTIRYMLLGAVGLGLAACSDDEGPVAGNGDGAAVVSASIGAVQSRMSWSYWDAGDCIGISGTTGGTDYVNVPYTTPNRDGIFEATNGVANGIFFQDASPATFSAYYPYSADVTADNRVITADVTDQRDKTKFDYLFAAGATGSLTDPALRFSGDAAFNHAMSMLNIEIMFYEGFRDPEVFKNLHFRLSGVKLSGEFDTATGIATATGEVTDDYDLDANFPTEIFMPERMYEIILFPQEVQEMTLSVDDGKNIYSCTFTPTLEAGKRCDAWFQLRKTGLSVESTTIKDWVSNGSSDDPATQLPDYTVVEGGEFDISTMTNDVLIKGAATITGKSGNIKGMKIVLAEGAELTAKGLNIGSHTQIVCDGNATIIFDGRNFLDFYGYEPAIVPGPENTTLTLKGINQSDYWSGTLIELTDAWSTTYGVAIGVSNPGVKGGNIVIDSGYFYIRGMYGCHIGSLNGATIGDITINGGIVVGYMSTEYTFGAMIGTYGGHCGKISMTGGTVKVELYKGSTGYTCFGQYNNGTCEGVSVTGGNLNLPTNGNFTLSNPEPYPYTPDSQWYDYYPITPLSNW